MTHDRRLETAAAGLIESPTILIVPGLDGSDDAHWQTLWEESRSDCVRASLGSWSDPRPELWIPRRDAAIYGCPGDVILVAHSLGCITTAHWAHKHEAAARKRVRGALLVAPCDPERPHARPELARFAPVPFERLPFPSVLVASTNDPHARIDRQQDFARHWGSSFVDIGMQGHINSESRLGRWEFGQDLLDEILGGSLAASLAQEDYYQTVRYGIG
jgi:predicted alpha/beta hydrolase family esterase